MRIFLIQLSAAVFDPYQSVEDVLYWPKYRVTATSSTKLLTAAGSLDPRNVFIWCQNKSMDDAETTRVRQCIPDLSSGNLNFYSP